MLKFAFLLGIVFISFNLIWFLFTSLLKMTLGETGNIEKYILRVSQSYFLASVSALATINYAKSYESSTFLIIAGAVVLFLYLIKVILLLLNSLIIFAGLFDEKSSIIISSHFVYV